MLIYLNEIEPCSIIEVLAVMDDNVDMRPSYVELHANQLLELLKNIGSEYVDLVDDMIYAYENF